MANRYRIMQVRGTSLVKKILFDVPACSANPNYPWIYPNEQITSYSALANKVINDSGGTITDFSDFILYATNVGLNLDTKLPSYGLSNKIDVNDISANDRFYINRWDNLHPYIEVTSKAINAGQVFINMKYCLPDGTIVYDNVSWGFTTNSAQDNTHTFPWCWYITENSSFQLFSANIGIYSYQNSQIIRVNANPTYNPLNTANAKTFWGYADIIDPTNPIPSQLTGLGDNGEYEFTGDEIEMPDEPDETISGTLASGFLNIYSPSATNLQNFGASLWTNAFNVKWYDVDSLANLVLNTISDPINFIIGLFMLPVTPSTGSNDGIYLGGINVNTVSVPRVNKQFKTIDFGSINITELYGNYLDYQNSKLSIYLPYIGTAVLDVQEVNGGSVELQYIIDCFTGACVANVRCVKDTTTPWGVTYQNSTVHSFSGNVAIQLPISAGSFDTMTQGLINVGLGLGTNSPSIAIQGATNAISNVGGDATTHGALSSNTGKLSYQTPYLMFTRPIESRPSKLGMLHGYGSNVGGQLKQLSGYVVCSDVKLDGITATDNEKDMIESLLKSGVYV